MNTSKINVPSPCSASTLNTDEKREPSTTDNGVLDETAQKDLAKGETNTDHAEERMALLAHPALKLLTQCQLKQLQKNFAINEAIVQRSPDTVDFKPVVKLFTPDANCTWLLSELSPDLIAFALCDLGFGEPELGYVSLEEIYTLRGHLGLPVERDRSFVAEKTLSEYAKLARAAGRITV